MTAHGDDGTPSNSRPQTERELSVVGVCPYSFAIIVSLCFSVCGFIYGAWLASYLIKSDTQQLLRLTPTYIVKEVLLLGGLMMVVCLVPGLVAGLLLATLYNAVAKTTGGLRLHVREGTLLTVKSPRRHAWAFKLGRFFGKFLAKKE